jgi:hypothetical protein
VFVDEGYCTAAAVELDPDEGCLTYAPGEDAVADEWDETESDEWEEDEGDEDEEWIDDEEDEI